MKIQPIDADSEPIRLVDSAAAKPVLKSRFRRLFDRQFPSVLKISSSEKPPAPGAGGDFNKDNGGGGEFEPSSVCLAKMVQNYIEESNEKQQAMKCGRNRCNCFHGNNNDSSDDELDFFFGGDSTASAAGSFGGDASDVLKSLIPCVSVAERNLLADTAKIVEANKNLKKKNELRKLVTDGLFSLGYDSSVCKSKWDKSPSFPAGEYEYIDVIVEGGERLLIDVDFRSEFEVARATGAYKVVLSSLPFIFVGKSDRLGQIVSIVTEAAKQSLKKKGMPFPPWRQADYVRAKWLSPCATRTTAATKTHEDNDDVVLQGQEGKTVISDDHLSDCGELDLIFGENSTDPSPPPPSVEEEEERAKVTGNSVTVAVAWQPPAIKPKSVERGARIVTGLASLLKEKA